MINQHNSVRHRPGLRALVLAVLALAGAACSKQETPPATSEAPAAAPVVPAGFDFNGVWQAENNDVLKTVDGSAIPFKPEAAKLYAERQAAAKQGDYNWDSTKRCIPPGIPRLMAIAAPFDVIVDQHLVSMTFQYQRLVRFIYLDKTFPTNVDLTFVGESHGHWEGNVLVVATNKFKTGMVLDATGIPHSGKLQVTERFEMTAPDTVVDHVTITDEDIFTQPWQTDIVLKKQNGVQIQEDVCVERQGIHK